MVLKERQKSILRAAVERYVATARPVASRDILEELGMRVSPATIRNEMLALDELGYLEQPHTSAGRVPTDRGYRFFSDNLALLPELENSEIRLIKRAFGMDSPDEFVKDFSRAVSQISGMFSAAGLWDEDVFYENGLSEILDEPEFQDEVHLKSFARLADTIDDDVRGLLDDIKEEKIFIGEENPLVNAKFCAMFMTSWRHPSGFEGFLTIVGPKRTNYSKPKTIFKKIKEISKND